MFNMDTSKIATKTDIKKLKAELTTDIKFVKEVINELKEEIRELRTENRDNDQKHNTKLDRLQNTLDGFVGRVDDLSVDNEVGTHHTRELELKVESLEKRVNQLESSKQA